MINPLEFVINPLAFEEWRLVDIEGVVPNYYYASNCGRVSNIKGHIIKPIIINSGYLVYRLYNGSKYPPKYKHILAHRLVMILFNPIEGMESLTVNHDNGDKYFNYQGNLEWMTYADNNEHGIVMHHQYGYNIYNAKLTQSQLEIIVNELERGTSYKEILRIIGLEDTENNRETIGNIKRGKTYQREIKNIKMNRFND